MSVLDRLVPTPLLTEIDTVEVAVDARRTWHAIHDLDLARSPLVRTLFGIRTIPDRLRGKHPAVRFRLADLISTPSRPGFQTLAEDPPREVAVGAIGKVWRPAIPFVHVSDATGFASFDEPGYAKVAWALRVVPENDRTSRVEFELRVSTTDAAAARKFNRYFHLIGPASHFIRRVLLTELQRELGTPESQQNERLLPGDELIPDALGQFTHSIVIAAPAAAVWPWLVQMGCRRAGFYSIDLLDNGGVPSAHELRPDLQQLRVGDTIPLTPDEGDHFEVLRMDPDHSLVLGALFDVGNLRQLAFSDPRPERFWQVTWAFALEPLDGERTRLYARARAAFSPSKRLHTLWIQPIHHLMQTAQLQHLAERVEGRPSMEGMRDVVGGVVHAMGTALRSADRVTSSRRRK